MSQLPTSAPADAGEAFLLLLLCLGLFFGEPFALLLFGGGLLAGELFLLLALRSAFSLATRSRSAF